jgi:acetyltransferase-like isoleucine patch superfamily enzyme
MGRILNMQLSWPATILDRLRRLFEAHWHRLGGGRHFVDTAGTQVEVHFRMWFAQKILRRNAEAYWPVHPATRVRGARFTLIGAETSPGWSTGCEIDGRGGLYIGDYTQVAPNVRLLSLPEGADASTVPTGFATKIGRHCLIAMNATVGPGVRLGDFTIVGAGAVVVDSFPDGYCVVAGNPARIVSRLDPAQCEAWQRPNAYVGYTPLARIDALRGSKIDPALFDRMWAAA